MRKLLLFLVIAPTLHAASFYVCAGAAGGNWNNSAIWCTGSSGGSAAGSTPTTTSDVFMDSGSGSSNINVSFTVRSINCTGFTNTLTQAINSTITIGDGTAGASNVALKLVSGMTFSQLGGTRTITFASTSGTAQTVDFGGKTVDAVVFSGSGGSWQLTATINTGGASLTHTNGTLDTNGQTVTVDGFISNGTNTRTLTLGASAITTVNGGINITPTGLTLNAGTSSFTATRQAGTLVTLGSSSGAALTYYDVTVQVGPGAGGDTGTFTVSRGITDAVAANTGTNHLSNNIIVTNTLTLAGPDAAHKLTWDSTDNVTPTVRCVQNTGFSLPSTVTLTNVTVQAASCGGVRHRVNNTGE